MEGMTSFNKKLTTCAEELTKKVHRDHMSIWWETLQQLFAPLKCPISKPFAALVESPMGRLSSCLIRANLDGNDGPPVFYVLLVISRNLGGRDATTLPGKYTRKKQQHEISYQIKLAAMPIVYLINLDNEKNL